MTFLNVCYDQCVFVCICVCMLRPQKKHTFVLIPPISEVMHIVDISLCFRVRVNEFNSLDFFFSLLLIKLYFCVPISVTSKYCCSSADLICVFLPLRLNVAELI